MCRDTSSTTVHVCCSTCGSHNPLTIPTCGVMEARSVFMCLCVQIPAVLTFDEVHSIDVAIIVLRCKRVSEAV